MSDEVRFEFDEVTDLYDQFIKGWDASLKSVTQQLLDTKKIFWFDKVSGFQTRDFDLGHPDLLGSNSVYFFQAQIPKMLLEDKASGLIDLWGQRQGFSDKERYPKVSRKNLDIFLKTYNGGDVWVPFYLGKHESALKARLEKHITKASVGTGALKLGMRAHLFEDWKFKVSWFTFGNLGRRPSFLAIAENLLREQLNPIIGE
ncbi:MAG: hypothetical protein WCH62_07990 [Candidatus Omnitrophota bacterium]